MFPKVLVKLPIAVFMKSSEGVREFLCADRRACRSVFVTFLSNAPKRNILLGCACDFLILILLQTPFLTAGHDTTSGF